MTIVLDSLRKLVAEQLDIKEEALTPETSFVNDLNVDSLDLIELITAMEEEFSTPEAKLEIADEDAEKIQTIQNAIDYLHNQGIRDK